MFRQDALHMRHEYAALVLVADGLQAMVRSGDGCNVLTLARMAEDARHAARVIASAIERLTHGGVMWHVVAAVGMVCATLLNVAADLMLSFC